MTRNRLVRLAAGIAVLGVLVTSAPASAAAPAAGEKRWAVADLQVQTAQKGGTTWYALYSLGVVQFVDAAGGTSTRAYLGQGTCRDTVVHNELDQLGFVTVSVNCHESWQSQHIAASAFQLDPKLASASVGFDTGHGTDRVSWTTYPGPSYYVEDGDRFPMGTPGVGAGLMQFADVAGHIFGRGLAGGPTRFSFGYIGEGAEVRGLPAPLLDGTERAATTHTHSTYVRR